MNAARLALKKSVMASVSRPISRIQYAAPRMYSTGHEETYEEFTNRYVKFFENVDDQFELRRGLNNCFSYDLVPDVTVCEAALRAARRIDDYATGVRVFDALKAKVDSSSQYSQFLDALRPVKDELGILTSDEMNL